MKKLVPEYSFSAAQLNTISALANETGLTEQITRIVYARGVDTAEKLRRFMKPSQKNFLDPFLMKGMAETVRMLRARGIDIDPRIIRQAEIIRAFGGGAAW